VAELKARLKVSDMTIRRDLWKLESRGLVKRVHGGAVAIINPIETEKNFFLREVENQGLKKRIAACAVTLLHNGDSIFLDGGTTCHELSRQLPEELNLTVVTNSLAVAIELRRRSRHKVILLGGELEEDGNTVGSVMALENARKLSVGYCFFSAAGFTEELITNPGMIGTDVKRQMINNSRQRILLADSTKYNCRGLIELCRWDQINLLVTDSQLSDQFRKLINSFGVQIQIADIAEVRQ
jgi:DeoR/GlpR family transcriptional regulator of sugar metabolism